MGADRPAPLLRFDVVTLFPELFEAPLRASVIGRALERGILERIDPRPARARASAAIARSTTTRTAGERGW